jgi:hypothetical protein
MLMGQKYRVPRSAILEFIRKTSGINLTEPVTEAELAEAVRILERIKKDGLAATQPRGRPES